MSRLRRWMSAAALSALLVTMTYMMPTQAPGPIPLAQALAKAHGAVSALAVDMQVLAQWANAAAGRGLPYYQERLV